MGSLTLQVAGRPLRIGFLVREGHVEDVVAAARLNSAIAGGRYNPIIPVGASPDLCDSLIRLFRIDVLHSINDDAALATVVKLYSWLRWPHEIREQGLFQPTDSGVRLSVLDVRALVRFHWERYFQHPGHKSNCVLPKWERADPLAAVLALQFGEYADLQGLEEQYTDAYKKGLKAAELQIEVEKEIPSTVAAQPTPLVLTAELLEGRWPSSFAPDGVFVGDEGRFQDLVDFWDVRAAGVDLVFLPLQSGERAHALVKAHLEEAWRRRQGLREGFRRLGVWFSESAFAEHDAVKPLVEGLIPGGAKASYHKVTRHTWNGMNLTVGECGYGPQSILATIDGLRDGTPRIAFESPGAKLSEHLRPSEEQVLWALDISSFSAYEHAGFTIRPPDVPELNQWYSRHCTVGHMSCRVQRTSISAISQLSSKVTHLYPMKTGEVVTQLLRHAGIDSSPSEAGRIAGRVIAQMGGLEGCRVFKIRGVRKLIANGDARKGIGRNHAVQIILDREKGKPPSFARHEHLHIEPRDTAKLDKYQVFDYLVRNRVFRTGLRPLCHNCELRFWLAADALGDEIRCEYCGHVFPLGPGLRSKGSWQFRLSGLFAREDRQEGAIPVVLTLLQLLRRAMDHENFMYATSTELKCKERECESDLIVVDQGMDGRTQVLLGECKSNGEIDDDDIDNLRFFRQELLAARLDPHLIFSKTAMDFSDEEKDRFRGLVSDHIHPILFTGRELEPYEPYSDPDEGRDGELPRPYAFSFEEMAMNSAARYLKKSSPEGSS